MRMTECRDAHWRYSEIQTDSGTMVTGGAPGFLKTSSARIGVGDNSRGESQCLSDGIMRQNGGEIVTGE